MTELKKLKPFFPEAGGKKEKKGISLIASSLLVTSHPAREAHAVPALPSLLDPISITLSLEAGLSAQRYLWVSLRQSSRNSAQSALHLDFDAEMAKSSWY